MNYGRITEHGVGIIMKEMVRRAMAFINKTRRDFEVKEKDPYFRDLKDDDFFTTCDTGAQEIYLKMIQENFPGFGIIGEEDSLKIEPLKRFKELYWVLDPVDGTKALIRRQSDGIGTMIALVDYVHEEVLCAAIGDIMTGEVYYFRPESHNVWRVTDLNVAERLKIDTEISLSEQYVSLREYPSRHCDIIRRLVDSDKQLFKNGVVEGGSIGIHMAKLWKGQYGAVILPPGAETPWDSIPIAGISKALGFAEVEIFPDGKINHPFKPSLPKKVERRESTKIFVHQSRIRELVEALDIL